MKYSATVLFLFFIFAFKYTDNQLVREPKSVKIDTLTLTDTSRNRRIPIAIYSPLKLSSEHKVVIFNPGYGGNKGDNYLAYNYLTSFLAENGYVVVSVQHELQGDDPLPMKGDLLVARRSNWEKGVANIMFLIKHLQKQEKLEQHQSVSLIGHSNGGDIVMLFGQIYPTFVNKIISLDSRRMPFPRIKSPKIYSLRSSDQQADPGVIPTLKEQNKWGAKIVKLTETNHNDMDETGSEQQHKEINQSVLNFLKD